MPRIPVVQAQQDIPGSTRLPTPDAGALTAPSRALAQGAQYAGQNISQAALTYKRAQDELTEMDTRLDIAEKTSRFQFDVAAEEVRLRESGMEPDAYAVALEQRVQEIRQTYAQQLRYPASAPRFQLATEPSARKAIIDGRYRALAIKDARVQVGAGQQLREMANAKVFDGDDEADRRASALVQELVQRGIWSGEQGAAAMDRYGRVVSEAEIERDMSTPSRVVPTLRKLLTGGYTNLDPSRQQELARSHMQRIETDARRAESEAKERWQMDSAAAERGVMNRAQDGSLTEEELRLQAEFWRWDVPVMQRIRAVMKQSPEEKAAPSNPDAWNRVLDGVYVARPTLTEGDLKKLHTDHVTSNGALGINAKDYQAALNTLTSRQAANRAEGRAVENQDFTRAKSILQAAMGIPDLIPENIDPQRLRLWYLALDELIARSDQSRGGRENALEAVREIAPRYTSRYRARQQATAEDIKTGLRYENDQALEQDFRQGRISRDDFRQQRDRLIRLKQKKDEDDAEQARLKALQEKAQGSGEGWGSWLQNLFGGSGQRRTGTPGSDQ